MYVYNCITALLSIKKKGNKGKRKIFYRNLSNEFLGSYFLTCLDCWLMSLDVDVKMIASGETTIALFTNKWFLTFQI